MKDPAVVLIQVVIYIMNTILKVVLVVVVLVVAVLVVVVLVVAVLLNLANQLYIKNVLSAENAQM